MTTLTLPTTRITPVPVPERQPAPESRLQEYTRLIHDACFRCAGGHHSGLDMDDMVQEASLAVWRALQKKPDANRTYIWKAAWCAALDVFRRNRRSVDRPGGGTGYEVVSWEGLASGENDDIQDALARRWRRGETPDPTQDIAVARLMRDELEPYLTSRERQAFHLLLKQSQTIEIAGELKISQAYAHRLVMGIRVKAARLWELQETRVDPSLAFCRCYERNRDKYNAHRRAKRQAGDYF